MEDDHLVDEALRDRLWVHRGEAPPMHRFHRHDDLEINVVLAGDLDYLFGGTTVTVPEGATALFWAATPHRLLTPAGPRRSDVCWIHVPLAVALRWALPDAFSRDVLTHGVVVVPTATIGDHVVDTFRVWQRDLADDDPDGGGADAVLLEAQALTLRILRRHQAGAVPSATPRPDLAPVARMARFAAEHFREPVSAADVARSAHLTPNYATTLFRSTVGLTLGEQLTRHRVAEAQRLLLTTTLTTAAVAHAAGFGSQSSLYAHFTRACGCSPAAYRRALPRPGGGPPGRPQEL